MKPEALVSLYCIEKIKERNQWDKGKRRRASGAPSLSFLSLGKVVRVRFGVTAFSIFFQNKSVEGVKVHKDPRRLAAKYIRGWAN